jgi:eukaryotic-like serine/threonine-protein kinase
MPHSFLAGFIYTGFGRYEKVAEEAQKAIDIDPDSAISYAMLAGSFIDRNLFDDAENIIRRASDRKLEVPEFNLDRYDIAFLRDDKAAMAREVGLAQGNSGVEDWISYHQAFSLGYKGRLQEARKMSLQAADLAEQSAHRERAALYEAGAALLEGWVGNSAAAKRSATAALDQAKNREMEYGAALALALAGDPVRPQIIANDLERQFPSDTAVRFNYLPTLRAVLALNHGEPSKAIQGLQIAAVYELGRPRCNLQGFFGALYPVYVRGMAYLAAKQGAEAAVEFQKILDHRGIVLSDPIGALARLQLGRAYALAGDTAKAKAAYQDFLTLWKDADPNVPILKQANAEYARLR